MANTALLLTTTCWLLALLPKGATAQDTQNHTIDFQSLYLAHRWFELRDLATKDGVPSFFQGAVACAFNDLRLCEQKFKSVFESSPRSYEAIEAHRLLASVYFRQGKYREALVQIDALLQLRPTDADALDDRPFLSALQSFPDQTVVRSASTTLELTDNGLPFSINGVPAAYWFDTGANVSVLTESEAKRFGMRLLLAPIKTGDVTGSHVETRIAVADKLVIGGIQLRSVPFLVFADDQPPFNQLPLGSRGLIGIPVLLAFQRFVWHADKKFEIGTGPLPKTDLLHANLCFDGHHPVAQIQYERQNLAFTLDTGATNTDLYPPFAAEFPELMRTATKNDSYKMEGAAGPKNMNAAVLPSLRFSIGGFPVVLRPAGVLLTNTVESSKLFHGNLGIDLLQQAHKTTVDFQSMMLTLE